jgi:hypothetical protein
MIVTKAKLNCVAFHPPGHRTGRPCRPKIKGEKIKVLWNHKTTSSLLISQKRPRHAMCGKLLVGLRQTRTGCAECCRERKTQSFGLVHERLTPLSLRRTSGPAGRRSYGVPPPGEGFRREQYRRGKNVRSRHNFRLWGQSGPRARCHTDGNPVRSV